MSLVKDSECHKDMDAGEPGCRWPSLCSRLLETRPKCTVSRDRPRVHMSSEAGQVQSSGLGGRQVLVVTRESG